MARRKHYHVYVVELSNDVLLNARFMRSNPGYQAGKPCVYVGMTGLDPNVRFDTRDRFRIRFISNTDASILKGWRASNNKKLWQKAVSILESRNLSPEEIAAKVEQTEGNVERWIKAFNRFGLEGLKKPAASIGKKTSSSHAGRSAVRNQKARRILEIVHAKPSA